MELTLAYVAAHANLTEIDQSLKLLWRNNIDPSKVVLGLGCRPIRAWWGAPDLKPGEFTCVDKVAFTYFTNVCNLALDLLIFSMPIPVIMKLRVTRDRRISLLFLFSIGLGVCVISAARLSFVFGVSDPDFTCMYSLLAFLRSHPLITF